MMRPLDKEEFICLDCETTGLDLEKDRIVEIAVARFSLEELFESFEALVDPGMSMPETALSIHHISNEMVQGQPPIETLLPELLPLIEGRIVVGHGVLFDLQMVAKEATRAGLSCQIEQNPIIDTLRLARLYGQSQVNSLESLRIHFNIPEEGAHRAMNDVLVNIQVFKKLVLNFRSLADLHKALEKPIMMRLMPLGKYKGRLFKEIPEHYLRWAAQQNFDQDLLYSLRSELKRRKTTNDFIKATNPFSAL